MIEKSFQMDDLLYLMGPEDFQYLFYLRVFASFYPELSISFFSVSLCLLLSPAGVW